MIRIFTTLALFTLALLAVTLLLGLYIGDLHEPGIRQSPQLPKLLNLAIVHKMLGLASALAVVFVNSIVVTYFIGTSRWCKEVVETYSLDRELLRQSVILKRRTFPWAVLAMLAIVGVIALGAAADPGTGHPGTETWVIPHLIGALVGLAFIVWTFVIEAQRIRAHHEVITEILSEVKRIRAERGLEV
ncbi:MAG TPA: hypothetical protein VGY55_25320 [Pirellulales bacterium]|jgi:hypothetical protein|nr:hypothetical protein [Pirellulales bacterium]